MYYKKIFTIALSFSMSFIFGQVNLNVAPGVSSNSNAFMDASENPENLGGNVGRGLGFPQTDLRTFTLDTNATDGIAFPSYYDGMVVFNTATTGSTSDANITQTTNLSRGFYYFSNPNGKTNGNLSQGQWLPIGGDAAAVKAWSLGGNTAITKATLDANNMVTNGNYMGTQDGHAIVFATKGTVGSGSTATTGNIARLIIGGDGAGNIIKETTVGGTKQFDFALKVFGKARFTEGIVTSKSTYPDYVFDNYFTGKSEVNPSYQFMKLDEVEKFIKENNHLPGVTKIDDLSKDGDAYMVDVSETSIQTLEKVEELYLHVIEQQKQIKALKAEIAELKKK